jgi:Predicted restriction endonuclease
MCSSDLLVPDNQIDTMRSSTLKEYFVRYLQTVRGSSSSTTRHYLDALNNISRRLVSKQLVQTDIYEIADPDYLVSVRDILFADPEFVAQNERGNQMYSAGLNNYIRFASGEDYIDLFGKMETLDIPLKPEAPITVAQTVWKRSNILRIQTLISADFKCEINSRHETFIAEKTGKPYMESHHAIPMRQQPHFDNSLDIYANLICLCPICHRKIHYGIRSNRIEMMQQLYQKRSGRLAKSGIVLSLTEFIEITDSAV